MAGIGIFAIVSRKVGSTATDSLHFGIELLVPGVVLSAFTYQIMVYIGSRVAEADEVDEHQRFQCCVNMTAGEALLWLLLSFLFGGGGIAMILLAFLMQGDNNDESKFTSVELALLICGSLLLAEQIIASTAWCYRKAKRRDEEEAVLINS